MKGGGQILWSATTICEMSKTSWVMGKYHMKDDLENHLKDELIHLVHWWHIIRFLQKIKQEFINLVGKHNKESLQDMR